jgi:hypothetical protein
MFYAQIRLYEPEGYAPDGRMFVKPELLDWRQVPYMEPDECTHGALPDCDCDEDCDCPATMCRECVDSWECDWEVVTPSWI